MFVSITGKSFHQPLPTPEPQFLKSDAIVLRCYDYSETSFILSLLTRDHGMVSVLAKGARRGRSIFEGEIDLFARGQAVILVRPRASVHILTEFSCRDRHLGLRTTPARAAAAQYAAQVVADASPEGEGQPPIYDLMVQTLSGLETGEIAAVLAYFQVHLLRLSGFTPNLQECAACGRHLPGERVAYNFTRAGPTCTACTQDGDRVAEVSGAVVSLIGSLVRSPGAVPARVHIPPTLARETVAFLGHVIAAAFEREPKALETVLAILRGEKSTGRRI